MVALHPRASVSVVDDVSDNNTDIGSTTDTDATPGDLWFQLDNSLGQDNPYLAGVISLYGPVATDYSDFYIKNIDLLPGNCGSLGLYWLKL